MSRIVMVLPTVVTMLSGICWVAAAGAADWPQFRGPHSNSVTHGAQPPATWSETENIAWKAPLPGRGPSSPIVIGDRVVVTCSSGFKQDRLHVLCFDTRSGKRLWDRQFWATGRTITHPTSANAAPTPASDGKLIFAFYSSNDLICLDLDGNLQWFRGLAYDFPRTGNDGGMASSPAVVADLVVAQLECKGSSFVTGIDKATGESRWRIPRPRALVWSSPIVMHLANPALDVVLLQSPSQITAHDPANGKELWAYREACDAICSAVVSEGAVYVPSNGMTALKPNSTAKPEVLWNAAGVRPGPASPVVDSGHLFVINRAGVLTCASTADGQILSRVRLQGEFWATPALVDNRLYCLSQDGDCQVVEINSDGRHAEVIGKSKLEGPLQGSPAICDGALYIRSDHYLWKIIAP